MSAPLPAALPPSIPIVDSPCFLCGATAADPVWRTPDRAFGVPGSYAVVRCRSCGFLYQRPRVADAHLAACYPDHYPRHQEPSPRVPLKGKPGRVRAARWALASGLGYRDWLAPGGLLIVEVPASLDQAVERAGASCGAASRPSRAITSGACASGFATAARSGSRGSPNGAQPMARSSSAWSSRSRSSPAPGAGKPSVSA